MDPPYVLIVILSFVVLNAICLVVIVLLWLRIRPRFSGADFWLAGYCLQFCGAVLILLRGALPPVLPVIAGNGSLVAGAILVFMGLERFVDKRGPQIQNAFVFMFFLAVHAHFFFLSPNLAARNINISITLLIVFGQCAWLLFRRVEPGMRGFAWGTGLVFVGFCLVSIFRIAVDLALPVGDDFFHSNTLDLLALIAYQMVFIALTFTLSLMVNLRLFGDLERDIAIRRIVETALRESEEKFSKAFHSSPDAMLIGRVRDGRLLEVNDSFCRLSEYTREETLGHSASELSLWADPSDEDQCTKTLIQNRRVRELEYTFRTKSGEIRQCLYSGEIIDLAGERHILSVVRDITERNQAGERLRRSEQNFREVFENSAQGIFILDVEGEGKFRIRESNLALGRTAGFSRDGVDGKLLEEAFPAGAAQAMRASCLRCLTEGNPVSTEDGFELSSGRKFLHTTLAPVHDSAGRIYRIIGTTLDITERIWAEETLRLRLTLWEYATQHTMEQLLQKALDEIEGITGSPLSYYHFVAEDQASLSLQSWSTRTRNEFCKAKEGMRHANLAAAGSWAECIRQRRPVIHNDYASLPDRWGLPEGHPGIVRELAVPTFDHGRIVAVLGIGNKSCPYEQQDAEHLLSIADILWVIIDHKRTDDEIRALQQKLEEMAVHDSLTGLYNRYYLDVTIKRELARAAREKYPVSFIMIDIDRFKEVNDAFGHKAGDAVLQNLSSLLLANSRASDIIFRVGGEEFLAVLPKVRVDLALQIAEKWRKNFVKSTMLLGYGGVKATISCGVAGFPRHGSSEADLIIYADKALYQAKAAGRNRSLIWKETKKKARVRAKKPRAVTKEAANGKKRGRDR
ncbi:MAG: diguanylate cyclase [Anaerolineales bacterium]|nr:diguanylate cyclase [Anaerolineales bacterium]